MLTRIQFLKLCGVAAPSLFIGYLIGAIRSEVKGPLAGPAGADATSTANKPGKAQLVDLKEGKKPENFREWFDAVKSAKDPQELDQILTDTLIDSANGRDRALELTLLARLFASRDPVAFLSRFPFDDPKAPLHAAAGECMKTWARRDPKSAYEWMRTLPKSRAQTEIYSWLTAGATLRDANAGFAFVRKAPDGKWGEEVTNHWAVSLAQSGKLAEWGGKFLEELPLQNSARKLSSDPKVFSNLYTAIVKEAARSNPETAAQLLNAARDPALARDLIADGTLKEAVNRWATRDANNLGTWLRTQKDSPLYDGLTCAFVERIFLLDRGSAFEWAQTIKDDGEKSKMLARFK